MSRYLPYGRQAIDQDDVAAVTKVLLGDYLTTGPLVPAFEQALAERVDVPEAVSCSSGTAALHLAALALNLGPGDLVVVPSITFVATANAVRYVGADVVFADVDPDTGLMGAEQLETALRRTDRQRVKAVFPVHLAGQAANMSEIAAVARPHGIAIVEDACHALGTICHDATNERHTIGDCRHSDMAAFSFHPVKAIAMGEGGAVTTRDTEVAKRLHRLRSHGIVRDVEAFKQPEMAYASGGETNRWYHELVELGFNYRASDLHCALGLSQLRKLSHFIATRQALATRYDSALKALSPFVRPLARVAGCHAAWHLYIALIDFEKLGLARHELMSRLHRQDIGTQVHYIPVHLQPYYRERYGAADLPGANRYYARCLSLPLFVGMTDADVDRVVGTLATELGFKS